MTGERRQGLRGLPMGVSTTLGWGLIGPKQLSVAHASCHCISFHDQQAEINRDVEKVFARDFEPVDEEREAGGQICIATDGGIDLMGSGSRALPRRLAVERGARGGGVSIEPIGFGSYGARSVGTVGEEDAPQAGEVQDHV